MKKTSDAARLLSVKEAAEFLGTSERALRARINRRAVPFRKWGGKVILTRQDLEKFVDSLPAGCSLEEATKL